MCPYITYLPCFFFFLVTIPQPRSLGSKIAGYKLTTDHLGSRSRWEYRFSRNGLQSLFVNHINISKG